jgi:hypothetical protein
LTFSRNALDRHIGVHILLSALSENGTWEGGAVLGAAIAQQVEHVLGKDEVSGSIPDRSSIIIDGAGSEERSSRRPAALDFWLQRGLVH